MLSRNLLAAGILSLAASTLGACQSDAQQAPAAAPGLPGQCREEAAEGLAGKRRVSDAEARQTTGATIVRQIRPGEGRDDGLPPGARDHRDRSEDREDHPRLLRVARVARFSRMQRCLIRPPQLDIPNEKTARKGGFSKRNQIGRPSLT